MKTKTNNVVTIPSFDTAALLERVRGIELELDNVAEGRKGVMAMLVAEYGEAAIKPASQGGINCRAFRTGTKDETRKEEASRLGMKPSKARELADVIGGINAIRHNVWQEYQRAYFGREPAKAAEPATTTPAAKAANDAKAAAKAAKVDVDLARAALIVASVGNDDKAKAAAKAKLDEAKAAKETADKAANDAKAAAKAADDAKAAKAAGESVADLIQRAIDKAKAAGMAETVEALTEALATV